ncbi:hypothetical protein [Mumia zhuanghuii]|uniref:NfeD-like C-terminal domain-containing protein n=1 Tax=Mumia zhuanghuii TaxID=2585211 RepID=A0A5C4MDM7_9ACTN|nr:hypothetical protein [Mumia zhuanghuii]TNC31752.1 hypothetical protein FHE65_30975 [Mumia zhuanghuii]TNC46531.1 hypothetical protein FHE65_12420 [Mumia zhuanghuii]
MSVYVVLGLVGLVLLAASLLIGDLFEGLTDLLPGDAFSSAVIGGFVAAFGFGGAFAEALALPLLVTLPVAVVSGVVVAWFAGWLTGLVRGGGSDGTPSITDSVGRSGRVVSEIPRDGYGLVRIVVGGHTLQLNARAAGPLGAGSEVHVTEVLSPTAVTVAPAWDEIV